jgi:hypothetical protein
LENHEPPRSQDVRGTIDNRQGRKTMSTQKDPIDLFSIIVSENGGAEVSIPTNHLDLVVKQDQLLVVGVNLEFPPAAWGVQLNIHDKIEPGSYPLINRDPEEGGPSVTAIYNSKKHGSSWIGQVQGGVITLLEVDLGKKFARGTFEFIAVDKDNPNSTAKVTGGFSLTE